MDLSLTVNAWLDEEVIFAQQLGVKHVFAQVDLHQVISPLWDPHSLAGLNNRIEKAGLILAGISAVIAPQNRGRQSNPRQAAALERVCRLIEAAGADGIGLIRLPRLFIPLSPIKSVTTIQAARDRAPKELSVLLERLAEAANRAGVKLAIPAGHPVNDLLSPENQDPANQGIRSALLESLQNPLIGLDAVPGLLLNYLQHPLNRLNPTTTNLKQPPWDKIFLVTLENSLPDWSKPIQARLDAGGIDIVALCWQLKQTGYSGLIHLGQQPHWNGDSQAGHRAQAFAVGYLNALLQGLQTADK